MAYAAVCRRNAIHCDRFEVVGASLAVLRADETTARSCVVRARHKADGSTAKALLALVETKRTDLVHGGCWASFDLFRPPASGTSVACLRPCFALWNETDHFAQVFAKVRRQLDPLLACLNFAVNARNSKKDVLHVGLAGSLQSRKRLGHFSDTVSAHDSPADRGSIGELLSDVLHPICRGPSTHPPVGDQLVSFTELINHLVNSWRISDPAGPSLRLESGQVGRSLDRYCAHTLHLDLCSRLSALGTRGHACKLFLELCPFFFFPFLLFFHAPFKLGWTHSFLSGGESAAVLSQIGCDRAGPELGKLIWGRR
mmetsp:Transcript_28474/g.37981  ORF Transcript_28474/g.37981 Transcript_28474/m.37981 type:complete len:313 (-) Transcript_28474:190-1128(-)